MHQPNSVRKFEYRPCRVRAGLEVEFVTKGATLRGICKDVSDEGIRATLDGSVDVGSTGLLILRDSKGALEIEAQAAYLDECYVGLAFLFRTSWERAITFEFIASIADNQGVPSVIPFP
jgi:hypothetical protein